MKRAARIIIVLAIWISIAWIIISLSPPETQLQMMVTVYSTLIGTLLGCAVGILALWAFTKDGPND